MVIHWYQNKNYYNTLTLRKKIENAISTGEITPHLFFRFSQTKTDNAKWPDVLFFFGGVEIWRYFGRIQNFGSIGGVENVNIKYYIKHSSP